MFSRRQFESQVQGFFCTFSAILLSFQTSLLLHTVSQLQQECELTSSQGSLMKGGADVLRAGIKSASGVQVKFNRGRFCI